MDKTISRFFFFRGHFIPGVLHFLKCWCFLLIRISLKTARLAATLSSLCRDRFGVHCHPSLEALPVVRRVSRVHVSCVMRCNAMLPPPQKKKLAAAPNSVGAAFEFSDASSSPSKRSFFFFFFVHVFISPVYCSKCWCFAQILCYLFLWNCTARHNSCLPCAERQVCLRYSIIQVWARVPCLMRACAVCSA